MDAISSSTGLVWLFTFIFASPIFVLLFSAMIWMYKNFKRISFIAYIANIVCTLSILWVGISNMETYFSLKNNIYNLCIINCIFILISIVCVLISIVYYRKNKVVSNTLINIATILSVVVWFAIIKMVNMYNF